MPTALLKKKLEYWGRQLLDLGKRNKMINYRETIRTTLKLIEPEINEFFKRIAINEESMTFQRAVDKETDIRVYSILSLLENLSVPIPVTIGDIKTVSSTIERQKTLRNLRSKAKLALEEQGTNILYLSFGFLEWKDGKGASAQWLKSPLVIVPVSLTIDSIHSPYSLKKHDDDVVINPTLLYYLETEHGLVLPSFDSSEQSLDDYLKSLEPLVDQRGWRINRDVSLGLLSFLKISMYKDLLTNRDRIMANPVIRTMAGDSVEANSLLPTMDNFDLDSVLPRDSYHVLSADSSQRDAIHYSKNGISFVMQGPPGTGKSQTITNIIAEALANGKKILFVSEKMAALQVVFRRLQEAHLADFCLPLHSYKASKRVILEQVGENLNLKPTKVKDIEINKLDDLAIERAALNQYASDLHKPIHALEMSCYEVFSKLLEVDNAQNVSFQIREPLSITQIELNRCISLLKRYSDAVKKVDYSVTDNPWTSFKTVSPSFDLYQKIEQYLVRVVPVVEVIYKKTEQLKQNYLYDKTVSWSNYSQVLTVLKDVASMPKVPVAWLVSENLPALEQLLKKTNTSWMMLGDLEASVESIFLPDIYTYDLELWENKLIKSVSKIHNLSYFRENGTDFYAVKNAELISMLSALSDNANKFIKAVNEINLLLGTSYTCDSNSISHIKELLDILDQNININPEWFTQTQRALGLLSAARKQASAVESLEESVLVSWEKEILTLDFVPILMRFKTDYTSVFKVFKSQYRVDKKTIQLHSRSITKRIEDHEVLDLLKVLKEIRDAKAWFETNNPSLSSMFGRLNNGLHTNWGAVEFALDTTEQLYNHFNGAIPPRLVEIVSLGEYAETTKTARSLYSQATECFHNAREIIKTYEMRIDVVKDSMPVILDNSTLLINYLGEYQDIYSQINPCLRVATTSAIDVFQTIPKVYQANILQSQLNVLNNEAAQAFGELYKKESTDWNLIQNILSRAKIIQTYDLSSRFAGIASEADKQAELMIFSDELSALREECVMMIEWVFGCFTDEAALDQIPIPQVVHKLQGCLANINKLEAWIDFCELRSECISLPISSYIEAIESKKAFSSITDSFLKSFYQAWINGSAELLSSIRKFRRNQQDNRIEKFVDLDERQLLIAQMRIREKIISGLPSTNRLLRANDEVSILTKELGKKRNIMPLRKLFKEIPNLLQTLKPCLMMSPLSVSYFLETEAYHFDLVIFDEASQIFPEDAIGAIYRGSQVVIAGDSKQLPPTNFFATSTSNNDYDYDVDDESGYEESVSNSILEEAALKLPNRTLLWHYRSKHEHLIAFSNREIYKNSLITFPDCTSSVPDMGVEYVFVQNGFYEGGGKNCNVAEAQRCVMLVLQHIQKNADRSLGIIAFSEKQQAVIENAILQFREKMPQYEFFFDESKEEPFFVKNLENVQGDERDTIIFSICYAKDRNGTMYMRFGPLGHEGGERRLNVAITRAKCNIKLVGSIQPSDIDLSRTKSEGVRMLRSYIEFAQKGESALRPTSRNVDIDSSDDFCDYVASFLSNSGYSISTHIGCSDYKVDIVVKKPNNPDIIIAGIECDGISYGQAKTARDRDHLRRTILKGMGWNIYRVWSTEWIRSPRTEEKALLSFLESCQTETDSMQKEDTQQSGAQRDELIASDLIEIVRNSPANEESKDNPYSFQDYKEANWFEAKHSKGGDNTTRIGETILHILSVEQPIHLDLLYKRMGRSFQAAKATEAVKNSVKQVIQKHLFEKVKVDKSGFVYTIPTPPVVVRVPGRYDSPRPMEYIHTAEVAEAMSVIISASYGISVEALQTECAKVFGFERKGPKIKTKMDAAVQYLIEHKKVKIIDNKFQLIGEKNEQQDAG